jgi:hypothetical protein
MLRIVPTLTVVWLLAGCGSLNPNYLDTDDGTSRGPERTAGDSEPPPAGTTTTGNQTSTTSNGGTTQPVPGTVGTSTDASDSAESTHGQTTTGLGSSSEVGEFDPYVVVFVSALVQGDFGQGGLLESGALLCDSTASAVGLTSGFDCSEFVPLITSGTVDRDDLAESMAEFANAPLVLPGGDLAAGSLEAFLDGLFTPQLVDAVVMDGDPVSLWWNDGVTPLNCENWESVLFSGNVMVLGGGGIEPPLTRGRPCDEYHHIFCGCLVD